MTTTQQPELPALPSKRAVRDLRLALKEYGAGFEDGPGIFGDAARLIALQAKHIDAQAAVLADRERRERPFAVVKSLADSVLSMLDERIKVVDAATHPFNDYFGDHPETIFAAKEQASELRAVRTQVRILGDRALLSLNKIAAAPSKVEDKKP